MVETESSFTVTPFGGEVVSAGARLAATRAQHREAMALGVELPTFDSPQKFTNPECGLDSSIDLHGAQDPDFNILHEKPEHRAILLLKMQLMTNKEVSEKTGYSQPWISQVCRQPWFRQRLLSMLHAEGLDPIQAILKPAAEDSIFRVMDLAENAASETVKLAANREILDRYLGKSVTKVENFDGGKVPKAEDLEKMDGEIERLESEIAAREGKV